MKLWTVIWLSQITGFSHKCGTVLSVFLWYSDQLLMSVFVAPCFDVVNTVDCFFFLGGGAFISPSQNFLIEVAVDVANEVNRICQKFITRYHVCLCWSSTTWSSCCALALFHVLYQRGIFWVAYTEYLVKCIGLLLEILEVPSLNSSQSVVVLTEVFVVFFRLSRKMRL